MCFKCRNVWDSILTVTSCCQIEMAHVTVFKTCLPQGIGPVSERDEITIQEQAMRCNDRKEAAKKVSDMSGEMFFAIFVRVGSMRLTILCPPLPWSLTGPGVGSTFYLLPCNLSLSLYSQETRIFCEYCVHQN